ncbi:MAG: hypothetical protein IJK00_05830 [Clostridia bacterium]|nr:hypothetical protein [Clostridia bacterium]
MKAIKRHLIIFLMIYLAEVLILSILIRDWEDLSLPYKAELPGYDITKIIEIDHIDSACVFSRTPASIISDDKEQETITLISVEKDQKVYTVLMGQDSSGFSAVVNEKLNGSLLKKIGFAGDDSVIGSIISIDVQGHEMTLNISGVCRDEADEPRLYISSERMVASEIDYTKVVLFTVSRKSYLPETTKAFDDASITIALNEEIETVQEKKRTILICMVALIFTEASFILTALREREAGNNDLLLANVYALAGVLILCSFNLIPLFRAYMEYKGFPIDVLAILMVSVLFLIHEFFIIYEKVKNHEVINNKS